jgi:TPR repeat protein/tRNA A-37 threonylcarbamoyl transferase component Bud32
MQKRSNQINNAAPTNTNPTSPSSKRHRVRDLLVIEPQHMDIQRQLGEGGFATVTLATWRGASVAVKRLHTNVQTVLDEKLREEARLMASLHHPNVVQTFGAIENPFGIVMEFMQGGSLLKLLNDRQPAQLAWSFRLQIAKDVAQGLVFLHSYEPRIIHADLKSANILLDTTLRAKLTDFGISEMVKSDYESEDGTRAGTPKWKAPELLEGDTGIDVTTDMYSYGMVLWELASHSEPFPDITNKVREYDLAKQIRKGLKNRFPDGTPECYVKWTESFWSLDPKSRPTAESALKQLEDAQFLTTITPEAALFFNLGSTTRSGKFIEVEGDSVGMSAYKKGMERILCSQYKQSQGYFELAVSYKEPLACIILIDLHSESGLLGPKSDQKATQYKALAEKAITEIRDRANKGEDEARYAYARCLLGGIGTPKNEPAGVTFLEDIAEKGHTLALTCLGLCYEKGIGGKEDHQKAFLKYSEAAKKDYGEALSHLGFCYEKGIGTERNEHLAFDCYARAAEKGYSKAQYKLAECYEFGVGVEVDEATALHNYLLGALQGHGTAQINAAYFLQDGKGGVPDSFRAIMFFKEAAAQGVPGAWNSARELWQEMREQATAEGTCLPYDPELDPPPVTPPAEKEEGGCLLM